MSLIQPFSSIFAPELYNRLRWFSRLRWFAVCGLCGIAVFGSRIGFGRAWPSLFVIAVLVALYNLAFRIFLGKEERKHSHYTTLRLMAVVEMVMDLAALLASVHFTGGMVSPLLPFVVFHMAIGTIMVATRIMWVIATGVCLVGGALYALEQTGVLASSQDSVGAYQTTVNLLMMGALVYGMVYLTDSVTSRFKRRSIERHAAIEKLKERSSQLQRSLAERETMERQKAHYMRISTHQLRSPLGTIKTSLDVLLKGYVDPGSESGKSLLRGVSERVDDLLHIVNDLLELTKMREGKEKAPWARGVYINQVLADIFDTLEPFATEKRVQLVADVEGVAQLDWGVPPDLVYAFENLIQNAIKYSRAGGAVRVTLRVENGQATVEVADQGIGIPAQLVDDVFLEFVRAPNAKQHTSEGTGLGLTIVREAIQAHGGEVSVQSEEGQGSRFKVILPLHYRPEEAPRGDAAPRP